MPSPPVGGMPYSERVDVVVVGLVRFFVAALALGDLLLEAAGLLVGVIQLGERVRHFHAADVQLEALHETRIVRALLRERRDLGREIRDERRLDQVLLDDRLEQRGDLLSFAVREIVSQLRLDVPVDEAPGILEIAHRRSSRRRNARSLPSSCSARTVA